MASIIDTTRIIDLPTKSSLSEGDVFVVDNENGATSKIPATAVSGSSTAGLVAEEYRDSRTYEVGEYCIHVEAGIPKFYKCTTKIATAESWTPAHWEGTDAGTEITDLNQSLTKYRIIEYTALANSDSSAYYIVLDNNIITTLGATEVCTAMIAGWSNLKTVLGIGIEDGKVYLTFPFGYTFSSSKVKIKYGYR